LPEIAHQILLESFRFEFQKNMFKRIFWMLGEIYVEVYVALCKLGCASYGSVRKKLEKPDSLW
jgi:hypothetical protein